MTLAKCGMECSGKRGKEKDERTWTEHGMGVEEEKGGLVWV